MIVLQCCLEYMDDHHASSLPKMYPKTQLLITSIAVLESRGGGDNRSQGLTHLQVAPSHQLWSMLGRKDASTMHRLFCREIILSESFSPVLNQNQSTLTLRGKICLSIFLYFLYVSCVSCLFFFFLACNRICCHTCS